MQNFFKKTLWITIVIVALFFSEAFAADNSLKILLDNEAHVGEQVILSVENPRIPANASLGWSVAPTTGKNPTRISLRSGGKEFAFTPVDTQPIKVNAYIEDNNGNIISSSELTVNPKEFSINIASVIEHPLTLWNSATRTNYELSPDVILANSTVKIRASLNPQFKGDVTLEWDSDASTEIISSDNSYAFIRRSQIGSSTVYVDAFNAAGVKLGSGEGIVRITLPAYVYQNSISERSAWQTWLKAQELWENKNYADAVKTANDAIKLAPRDVEISNGLKVMTADFDRFNKAAKLREEAANFNSQKKYEEALKNLRSAQIIWPIDDGATSIRNAEQNLEQQRLLIQQATWLKDTASAYDNEGLFEDAIDYYSKSMEVYKLDGVAERVERIRNRLSRIASADRYAGEGNRLEREGNLQEALKLYGASAQINPDNALTQHIKELASILNRRERQAKALYREGQDLLRKNNSQEALKRFKESMNLLETDDAATRVRQLERSVRLPQGTVLRTPEDFGIGTKSDAIRLTQEADQLYNEGNLDEAAAKYRKAQSISPTPEIQNWLEKLESNIRDRRSVQAANEIINKANQLYKAGKTKEALDLYKQSLSSHANPQIEEFIKKNQGK